MKIDKTQIQRLVKVNIDFEGLFSHLPVPVATSRVETSGNIYIHFLERTDISSVPDIVISCMEGTYGYQRVEMDFQRRCSNQGPKIF